MRKIGALGVALVLLISGIGLLGASIAGDKPEEKDMRGNTTKFITGTGFNEYGYNYVAHMFSGYYINVYTHSMGPDNDGDGKGDGIPPYEGSDQDYPGYPDSAPWTILEAHWSFPWRDVDLIMKWNDAWLSNQDRDDDQLLDRHYGYPTYIGSGAWETNHQSGTYMDQDGNTIKWNYFVKIIAVPDDAYKVPANANGNTILGIWYTADQVEIGPVIWGSFATIQQIENDPGADLHGAQYISPNSAGFGAYSP